MRARLVFRQFFFSGKTTTFSNRRRRRTFWRKTTSHRRRRFSVLWDIFSTLFQEFEELFGFLVHHY